MSNDDLQAAVITKAEGVTFDAELLDDAVKEFEGSSGLVPPMNVRPTSFDSIPEALEAYKEGALFEAGKGKNRGYVMTVGFGVAGILSLVTGGILMAKGRPVLGSIGLGASAGCGVGSYVTYPKTVPFVGYHLRVDDGMYVRIRLPNGLSDESFINLSEEQKRHRVAMDDYSVPTVYILEQLQSRRDHSDELASGLSDVDDGSAPEDEPDSASSSPSVSAPASPSASSSSSSSAGPPKAPASVSVSSSLPEDDDDNQPLKKPKKLKTPAISELSSAEQKAASASSGVTVVL